MTTIKEQLSEILTIIKANDPAVVVTFKTSSQPKGGDGVEIRVTSAATAGDLADTVDMAAEGFRRAKGLIREINDMQLGVDLEASAKAVEAVTNGRPEAGLREPY